MRRELRKAYTETANSLKVTLGSELHAVQNQHPICPNCFQESPATESPYLSQLLNALLQGCRKAFREGRGLPEF